MHSLMSDMSKNCLIFHIAGTMCSWGEIAFGTNRSTSNRPTKSAIIGIVAAALGIERTNSRDLMALSTGYDYIFVSAGIESEMQDYSTVETPASPLGEKTWLPPRSLELNCEKTETIVVRRNYLCNGYYSVFIVPKDGAKYDLHQIKEALEHPKYVPYLGRKSCPLSFPMCPTIEQYDRIYDLIEDKALSPFLSNSTCMEWGGLRKNSLHIYSTYRIDDNPTIEHVRNDEINNRHRWQFYERIEYEYCGGHK